MEANMEALEEVVGSNDHTGHIVKGKRTKRQRLLSQFGVGVGVGVAMSTSSSSGGGSGGGGGGGGEEDDRSFPSPTTSAEFSESTEEEEDMANCLILLAQGQSRDGAMKIEEGGGMERFSSRRLAEPTATTTGKAGFYVYECKTCNRSFPSFQALGGHRASHKKPKAMLEVKKGMVLSSEDEGQFNNDSPPLLPLQLGHRALYSHNKSRVHECSICGSEFSSGQALGGHMRRHRTSTAITTTMTMPIITSESQEAKKPRNVLSLDLNLPAPEEDHHRESKFPFGSKQQALGFSASALVDCHY